MSYYKDKILPRLVEKVCSGETFMDLRKEKLLRLQGIGLELGGGVGLNFQFYTEKVKLLYVIEPCLTSRNKAIEQSLKYSFDIAFIDYDEHGNIPIDTDSLDFVCSTWTMCTIPNLEEILIEVLRILNNSGELHFVEHGLAPDRLIAFSQNLLNPIQKTIGGGCNLNRKIDEYVHNSGLEMKDLKKFYKTGAKIGSYIYSGIAVKA